MIFKKNIVWNFPGNDDGPQNGLNHPGIQSFMDNPIHFLAREVPQNSSDAADIQSKKPVEVKFDLQEFPTTEFPGLSDFKKALQACANHWKTSKKTVAFCENALAVLGKPMLPVLKISDFNTTGVRIGKLNDHTSDWFKLTKAMGASDKVEGKIGSFGIGKFAPFACSDLRTVFYGTKDDADQMAFQGVTILPSHKRDNSITQGAGYYGNKDGNKPLLDFSKISPIFERTRTGADVYVMGFHPFPNWEARVIKSVIESFFVAFHDGQLIVKVGKTTLNKTSLPANISKHYAEPDARFFAEEYYAALTHDEAAEFMEEDFYGYGKVTLRIFQDKSFRKRVAMLRRSGMKIFDKGHFQTPLSFAGVFTAKGEKLDSLLRSLEPPSHDEWLQDRGDDPAESKRILHKLYQWINDRVRELVSSDNVTEIDAEGVSQYLPDDIDDSAFGTPLQTEAINEEPAPVLDMRIRSTPKSTAPILSPDSTDEKEEGEEGDQGQGSADGPENQGDGGTGGGGEGTGEGTEKKQDGGSGSGPDQGQKHIDITKLRIYCADQAAGRYRLLFEPKSETASHLRVFVIGEVGAEAAPIARYSVNGGPEIAATSEKGLIGPLSLPKGKRAVLDVVLKNSLRCALGVNAYAD